MEIEDHTEALREDIQHHAVHNSVHKNPHEVNIMKYALTSAIYAILAAMASMFAGYYANEAMIVQIKSSDSWSYYQAKSIKMNLLQSKIDIFTALNKIPNKIDLDKLNTYKEELKEINEKSKETEHESAKLLKKHVSLSRAVTLFQIAVAMTAFAIFIKREWFWYVSLAFAIAGISVGILSLL